MRRLKEILAYGNIIVAISAASLVLSWSTSFSFSALIYPSFIFLATLSAYGYMHLSESSEHLTSKKHPVLKFTKYHKREILILSILSALGATGLLLSFAWEKIFLLTPAVAISLFYPSTPIFKKGLRAYPGFKLPLISFSWAWACAFVPMILTDTSFDLIVLRSLIVFFWIYSLAIAFDIRDLDFDDSRLQTEAQKSESGAFKRAHFTNFLAVLFLLLEMFSASQFNPSSLLLLIPFILTSIALSRIKKEIDPLFISFEMEALPIIFFTFRLVIDLCQ